MRRPLCGDASMPDDSHALRPEIAHAFSPGRQVLEGVEAVEMVDGEIGDLLQFRQPEIDGHAPASVFVEMQAPPGDDAGAGRAEEDLERGVFSSARV